jgi:hypothetical protein
VEQDQDQAEVAKGEEAKGEAVVPQEEEGEARREAEEELRAAAANEEGAGVQNLLEVVEQDQAEAAVEEVALHPHQAEEVLLPPPRCSHQPLPPAEDSVAEGAVPLHPPHLRRCRGQEKRRPRCA